MQSYIQHRQTTVLLCQNVTFILLNTVSLEDQKQKEQLLSQWESISKFSAVISSASSNSISSLCFMEHKCAVTEPNQALDANSETVKLIINYPSITVASASRTKESLFIGGGEKPARHLIIEPICCAKIMDDKRPFAVVQESRGNSFLLICSRVSPGKGAQLW